MYLSYGRIVAAQPGAAAELTFRFPAKSAGRAQPKLLKEQRRAVLFREGKLRFGVFFGMFFGVELSIMNLILRSRPSC